MEIDFGKKCRACLNEDDQKRDIFVEFEHGITLQEILRNTTNFEISKDDGLSPFMCHNCTTTVIDFYNFKNIYQTNEKQMKALLATDFENIKDVSGEFDIKSEELTDQENGDSDSEEIKLEIYADSDNYGSETDREIEAPSYDCPNCHESFLNEEDLEHHLKNTHVREICKNPANTIIETPDPLASTDIEAVDCKKITKAARSKLNYEKHLEYWGDPPNSCNICKSLFKRKSDLKEHMDVHLDRRIHKCEICKKTFKRRTVLANHRRLHTKKIMTSQDSASAGTEDDFTTAQVKEENSTETFCNICDKSFASNELYKKHAITHNTHVCHVCGSTFKRKFDLNEHMDVHLEKRIHECEFCNKAFKRRGCLMHHRRIHTHPRQQLCTYCGKAFNAKSTLKTHIKLCHVKSRDFLCVICNARFPLKGTLDKHVKRHQERVSEFQCKECPAAYKDSSSLNRHVLERHNEKFVKPACEKCNKKFSSLASLARHVKNIHQRMDSASDSEEEGPLVICI